MDRIGCNGIGVMDFWFIQEFGWTSSIFVRWKNKKKNKIDRAATSAPRGGVWLSEFYAYTIREVPIQPINVSHLRSDVLRNF